MTAPTSNRFDSTSSAGASTGGAGIVPFATIRAPSSSDIRGPWGYFKPGQVWINTVANSSYTLTSLSSSAGIVSANWNTTGATSTLATLTADSGGALTPSAGNINILGTTNEITMTGSGSTITASLASAIVAPGSITSTTAIVAGTSITATLGNISATNGNLVLTAAGNKMIRTSVGTTTAAGANSMGSVTLVAGTATVATTAVTASSLIRLSRQSIGATGAAALGMLTVGTIVAGTSFVINAALAATATSLTTTDVSVVNWEIVN